MHVSAFSGGASAQANMSEGGDDGTLHSCKRASRADIIVPKCQVVILDCFYLCLNKPVLSENNVSSSTLVGVALSWASLACQLWLPSAVMRGYSLKRLLPHWLLKCILSGGACREKPLALTAVATAAASPAPVCLATSSYRLLKVSPPPQLAAHDMGGEQRVQEVQLIAPGGIGGVMGDQHVDVAQKKEIKRKGGG